LTLVEPEVVYQILQFVDKEFLDPKALVAISLWEVCRSSDAELFVEDDWSIEERTEGGERMEILTESRTTMYYHDRGAGRRESAKYLVCGVARLADFQNGKEYFA
jgi:hypothetical protein